MSLIDTIKQDFENLLGSHTAEIEQAGNLADAAAHNELVQAALGALLPPPVRAVVAAFVTQLDSAVQAHAAAAAQQAVDEHVAAQAAAAAPPAEPEPAPA